MVNESLLHRFRSKRGLRVTDITGAEWCEKQMEFVLLFGKRKTTKAMKIGTARHAVLEEEVVKKIDVHVKSEEDIWAIKFMSFIIGVNQLLFEGMTRELQLFSHAEGVWINGVIDEIRMPKTGGNGNPVLVETKTRVQDKLPAEPQQRNGRLQLMCYKFLWDNLVTNGFPSRKFFDSFSLDPNCILSEEIRKNSAESGLTVKTLHDVVRYYKDTCSSLPMAQDKLILRYELQKDNSVLSEDCIAYDSELLKSHLRRCIEFWRGDREATYTPEKERWKCHFCQFASVCPSSSSNDDTSITLSPKEINEGCPPSPSNTDPDSMLSKS